MRTRILAVLAALALLLCALPGFAAGAEEFTEQVSGDFLVRLKNDTATITRYLGKGGDVTIPGMIDGHSVTKIEWGAFLSAPGLPPS